MGRIVSQSNYRVDSTLILVYDRVLYRDFKVSFVDEIVRKTPVRKIVSI